MTDNPTAAIKTAFPNETFKSGDTVTINGASYTFNGKDFVSGSAPGVAGTASNDTKLETPPKWDEVQDARKLPSAGKYPNYWAHKTRSGHVIMLDDSKGAESVTIQHRGGSMLQIMPDGKVHIRAQNGQHTVVFGENRMYVTGAHDITVDGSASMNIKKDFNINAQNINFTASGDMNMKAQNLNFQPSGKMDIAGSGLTLKSNSNISIESHGAIGIFARQGFSAGSKEAEAVIVSSKDVGLESKNGRLILQSKSDMSFKSGAKLSAWSVDRFSIRSGEITAVDANNAVLIQKFRSLPPDEQKTISFTTET